MAKNITGLGRGLGALIDSDDYWSAKQNGSERGKSAHGLP
jgi:hypothetical protein